MNVTRLGLIARPGGPRIHLAAAVPGFASVCLTAPDRSQDAAGQTTAILRIVDDYMRQLGADRRAMLMAEVWLADMADLPAFVGAWNAWIEPGHEPAMSVVQASASRRDALVEIRVHALPAPDSGNAA